ncbi:alpha/beta fold hydrolase, partial [Ornithinimicrobium cerasi]|uniref:alpha/beta fold hydrolase n=1 Tax=Ornithinimicrobium cerasi TaxID=2248773 RepID=UPI001F2EE4AA
RHESETGAALGVSRWPSVSMVLGVRVPEVVDYAAFLPAAWGERVDYAPEQDRWEWHGHDVHVYRRRSPEARVRVIVVHGAGGNSSALWPIASLLPPEQFDLSAVDLPLYGKTVSPDPSSVRYQHWVDMLCDFVAAEDDGRPLLLLGASVGGMLAYEVAARCGRVAVVVATCLLDPRDRRVQRVLTRFGPAGVLAGPLARRLPDRLSGLRVPMSWVAALDKMSRNAGLSKLCASDPRGGGAHVPLGFLASYMTYQHVQPEQMRTPVILAHPDKDAWTPLEVSIRWFQRIAGPTELVRLRGCGHFPIEEPGLSSLLGRLTGLAPDIETAIERATGSPPNSR